MASTSLITECLTNKLRLPRGRSNLKINRVADFNVLPKGIVSFQVAGVWGGGSRLRLKPPSFLRSLTTCTLFLFFQLPDGSIHQTRSLLTPILNFQQEWASYLKEVSSVGSLTWAAVQSCWNTVSVQDMLRLGTKWRSEYWDSTGFNSNLKVLPLTTILEGSI